MIRIGFQNSSVNMYNICYTFQVTFCLLMNCYTSTTRKPPAYNIAVPFKAVEEWIEINSALQIVKFYFEDVLLWIIRLLPYDV